MRRYCCPRTYFYPRPPRGGRLVCLPLATACVKFLSTPSARRATLHHRRCRLPQGISIHALREEGDSLAHAAELVDKLFLSTPSARRATQCKPPAGRGAAISIHALREEGDQCKPPAGRGAAISIHALREEGDHATVNRPTSRKDFYPRPPRGGRPLDIITQAMYI